MKIATWNVNSLKVRLDQVKAWLASSDVDVLCLQEIKCTDDNFPSADFEKLGYHIAFSGQKTYNGVAIISKYKIENVTVNLTGLTDPQRRVMFATINGIRILNVYIVNGSEVGSEKFRYKMNWLKHLQKDLELNLLEHDNVVLLGDFNIAPADEDVYSPRAWQDKILCSKPERQAFADFIAAGMVDTFRLFDQDDESYSWWDYRQARFRRNMGLRIDFILSSKSLSKLCTSCIIDSAPRALERPSDHAPVMATFDI